MRKSMKFLVGLIVILIIAGLIWLGVCYFSKSKIAHDPEKQIAALRAGDYQKAYDYSSQAFKDATSFERFKAFVDQYPILKDNVRVTFYDKQEKDPEGRTVISGFLVSKSGDEIPIKYRLIQENNKWKIFALNVSALGEKPLENSRSNPKLENYLLEKDNLYAISYPKGWATSKPEKGTVLFSAPDKGNAPLYSTVNIQSVLASKSGGKYDSLDAFINNFKEQANKLPEAKILKEGSSEHDGMNGKYILVTYKYKGTKIRQLQYVFMRRDGSAFYAWAYTSPEENYAKYEDIAKQMLDTFDVKN